VIVSYFVITRINYNVISSGRLSFVLLSVVPVYLAGPTLSLVSVQHFGRVMDVAILRLLDDRSQIARTTDDWRTRFDGVVVAGSLG